MNMSTKLISVLVACTAFSCDALVLTGQSVNGQNTKMVPNFKGDVLKALDKSVDSAIIEGARFGAEKIIDKIEKQLKAAKIEYGVKDKEQTTAVLNNGIQDHQDMLTPTALTGEFEYKFTYNNSGTEEEVKIKRREITDLLGEMASIRMTKSDMDGVLTKNGDLATVASTLNSKVENLRKSKAEVLTKIVKLMKCLSDDDMYKSLSNQMAKDGLTDATDCLNAAHVILKYAKDKAGVDRIVYTGSTFEALRSVVNPTTTVDSSVKFLTAPVLQAFTTLLFLQRTSKDNRGEVRDLNKYLVTRGNARTVMKDTAGKLLLCDDISLEGSGLLALGADRDDKDKVVKDLVESLKIGTENAYVLPAAVLLDEKTGEPVIGTSVLPAPYLEYAINNGKLLPMNNIIIGVKDGVASVLTTYATSMKLNAKAAVHDKEVDDVIANNDGKGLSGVAGDIVPSARIRTPDKMIISEGDREGHVKPSGTTVGGGVSDLLSLYGAPEGIAKKSFKLDTKAATAIMNSLFANAIAVKDGSANNHTNNINAGPFYAARIADTDCPGNDSHGTVVNSVLYDSTAAIMLCSGKDDSIRALPDTDTQTVGQKKADVAKNISEVSKYVIPGFDVNSAGDYVVTGLNTTKLTKLDGFDSALNNTVLNGKGAKLLAAIKSITKPTK